MDEKKYGSKLEIEVNIEENNKKLIEDYRSQFQLSEKDYSDERIITALEDNNYNIENTFMSLVCE